MKIRGRPVDREGDAPRLVAALLVAISYVLMTPSAHAQCVRCERFDFLCCNVPDDGLFLLTSFTGGESMACGGSADGSWYYATSWVRWHCGAKLQVENPDTGACVVVEVADAGPADWVEERAGMPIVDASTLVCRDLFGTTSCGWSDGFVVRVTEVDDSTTTGPDGCVTVEPWPDVALDFSLLPIPDTPEDPCGRGASAGVPDLWQGDRTTARLELHNQGDGPAAELTVTLEATAPALRMTSWRTAGVDGSSWPADGPAAGSHDSSLTVELGTLGAGGRVVIIADVEAGAATYPGETHAGVRAFVTSIAGAYDKPSFDGAAHNVDGRQSWNGGDLRDSTERDVLGEELCDGADQDCDGDVDEDFAELGDPCTVGEAHCEATGLWACATDGSVRCDAAPPPDCPDPPDDPPDDDPPDDDPPSWPEDPPVGGDDPDVTGMMGTGCTAAPTRPVGALRTVLAFIL